MKATRIHIIVLLSVLLITVLPAQSQKVWSLEECIQTAKASNIQVQRQQLLVEAARSNFQTAKAGRLPSVSGWYTHNLSAGKTVNFEDYSYINTQYQDGNMGIQGTLPLFDGLKGWNLIRQSKYGLLSAKEQTQALENAVTFQVVAAYLQVLLSEELVIIAQDKLESSKGQTLQVSAFFENGQVARSEVFSMKSQEAQDALQLTSAKGNLDMAYLVLRQLLNLPEGEAFAIQKPTAILATAPVLAPPSEVFDFARVNQPRILAAQNWLHSKEAGLNASWGELSPSLSISGLFYSRYSELGVNPLDPTSQYSFSQQMVDNNYKRANINVNIPIFAQFTNRNRINQAKIQVLDARLALNQEQKTLREEIQRASMEAQTALAKLVASDEAVKSAEEANAMVKEQFEAGLVTSVDVKISGSQFVLAKANQTQARYELLLRSKILDFYQGKAIRL